MTTEAKLKYALKEMMLSKPLEDINVTVLCEKCSCHRQTFYYHYQDIYDLLAAIFLNEKVEGLEQATTIKDALYSFLGYAKTNFVFLRSSYNSAAHDLVDDFFYGKMLTKMFVILSQDDKEGLSKDGYRSLARRFSRIVGDEFGYSFKDVSITPGRFERSMKKFIDGSLEIVYPALVELAHQEKKGK
jgi:AcrR family transcriptional regulator